MKSPNVAIGAMVLGAVLAIAFWMLVLSPKRDEAAKLGDQVTQLEGSLATYKQEVASALEARKEFPVAYQQLVVLGKAVPAEDDTASLLVQLNQIAEHSHVRFQNFQLEAGGGGEAPPAPVASAPESTTGTPASSLSSPTEVAASTMPLGATIGPAGLGVMPYELTFTGNFFHIADFIKGLDSLVKTEKEEVSVNGRLLTINGFSLSSGPTAGFPELAATFSVTTYLTPPSQGVTAGATPSAPAVPAATPASTTTGGTP